MSYRGLTCSAAQLLHQWEEPDRQRLLAYIRSLPRARGTEPFQEDLVHQQRGAFIRDGSTPQTRLSEYRELMREQPEEFPTLREVIALLRPPRPNATARRLEVERWRKLQVAKAWIRAERARDISDDTKLEVLESGPCAYCGEHYPQVVDHIVPASRGGDCRRSNLAPACEWCNNEKRDRTPEEWREARRAVGLPWPPVGRSATLIRLFGLRAWSLALVLPLRRSYYQCLRCHVGAVAAEDGKSAVIHHKPGCKVGSK